MIDFLQNGNRGHLITPLLAHRYRVKDIHFHAAVLPNRGFVVFGRGSIGDGPRVSQLRIQHLILAKSNGQILWRKTIEYGYGDMPAVGNQGTVAVAEWLNNPRGVQVRLIASNGQTVGIFAPKRIPRVNSKTRRVVGYDLAFAAVGAKGSEASGHAFPCKLFQLFEVVGMAA